MFLLSILIVLAFTPHLFDSHAGLRQNESAAVVDFEIVKAGDITMSYIDSLRVR